MVYINYTTSEGSHAIQCRREAVPETVESLREKIAASNEERARITIFFEDGDTQVIDYEKQHEQ